MIEEINKVIGLQEKLKKEYGIIAIDYSFSLGKTVLLGDLQDFLIIAHEPIREVKLVGLQKDHKLITEIDDVDFTVMLSEKEYQEYKNSRATNTTKEKSGTL